MHGKPAYEAMFWRVGIVPNQSSPTILQRCLFVTCIHSLYIVYFFVVESHLFCIYSALNLSLIRYTFFQYQQCTVDRHRVLSPVTTFKVNMVDPPYPQVVPYVLSHNSFILNSAINYPQSSFLLR